MKICAFSDMHGQYDFKVEPCDIVLICGDIVPLKIQKYTDDTEVWIKTFFIPWCNNLPCEKVVFIAGNHDFYFERHPDRVKRLLEGQDKIVYLDCESYEYKDKIIYGTPWCKPFYNWAFMEETSKSDERYKDVQHIDILMSHDASYGVSDVLLQNCWWADGTHIGNLALRTLLDRTNPSLYVFGHLHSCQHERRLHNDTSVFCVSLLDENYKMTYEPLYFNLE
jgi:predicted phosphohydrolase